LPGGGTIAARAYIKRETKKRCILLLGMALFIYLAGNAAFLLPVSSVFMNYVLVPALWLGAAFAVRQFPAPRAAGRLRLRSFLVTLAGTCAVIFVLVQVGAGIWEGFGWSPYSFTPLGILTNLFGVGSALVGTVLARSYLVNSLGVRRPFLVIVAVSILFTFISLPLGRLTGFSEYIDLIRYAGNTILPTFSENLLVSYLVFLGGPLPAMVYQGIVRGFEWFCPILPDLGWMTRTLLGTLIPLFSMMVVQHLYAREAREVRKVSLKKENPAPMVLASIASVLIIWFAVGLFPVYPSVIVTGSMEPEIKAGDMVLVKKADNKEIKIGDIIEFRYNQIMVTHRVVDIKSEDALMYQTKGDNNPSADHELVSPQQVRGKVVAVIPKMGWPALFIRSGGFTEN